MKSHGLTYEEHTVGAVYRTLGRTVSEADICAFVNLCGFNEPLFMDMEYVAKESVFKGRAAPGAMTFCLSEGLIMQTGLIHGTGMSYLGSEIRIVAPVLQGDTLKVGVTITDKRETRKPASNSTPAARYSGRRDFGITYRMADPSYARSS